MVRVPRVFSGNVVSQAPSILLEVKCAERMQRCSTRTFCTDPRALIQTDHWDTARGGLLIVIASRPSLFDGHVSI